MSAIFGCVDFSRTALPENIINDMQTPFNDFKIDEFLRCSDNNVAMGCGLQYIKVWSKNDRLPINDTENGNIFTADCIIDNRRELIAELCPGEDSIPDGALLYKALLRWGADMAKKVYGAYSYALYNTKDNSVTLGVDHTAARALYYRRHGNRLYFATRMESILTVTEKKVNKKWIGTFLAVPYLIILDNPIDTPFEGVNRMVSMHYNVFTAEGTTPVKYHCSESIKPLRLGSDEEYKKAFRELYQRCVEETIDGVADNVGIMLSGGFDSSSVAAFAAKKLATEGRDLLSYTHVPVDGHVQRASKEHHIADETQQVLKTCELYPNIKPSFLQTPEADGFSNVAEILDVYETPYKSMINVDWISSIYKKVRQDSCRMLLIGQCGNFTVSYGKGVEHYIFEMFHRGDFVKAAKAASNYCKKNKLSRKKYFKYIFNNYFSYYYKKISYDNCYDRCLISKEAAQELGVDDIVKKYHYTLEKRPQNHKGFHYTRRLIGSDESMAHTSEYDTANSLKNGMVLRDPTRDIRIQNFCSSLPVECFVNDIPQTKRLVRHYCADLLPKEFLPESTPRGLQSSDWHERIADRWEDLYPVVKNTINSSVVKGLIDKKMLDGMITKYERVPDDIAGYDFRKLGVVYALALFYKKHGFE